MFILKFNNFRSNESNSSYLVVQDNQFRNCRVTVQTKKNDDLVIKTREFVMIDLQSDKSVFATIELENTTALIFQELIYFSQIDKTKTGRLFCPQFYSGVTNHVGILQPEIILDIENNDYPLPLIP